MEHEHLPYEQLIAYAASELNEADSQRVAAHTSQCTECNSVIQRYRRIRGLYRSDFTVAPPPEVLARAEAIVLQKGSVPSRRLPQIQFSPFFRAGRRFAAATALAVFLFILVLFFGQIGTVAAATRDALPGETLYPVKIVVEDVQLAFTLDPVQKAELHLAFAQSRVEEIEALDAAGKDEYISATSQSFIDQVNEADKLLTSAKKDNLPVAAAGKLMEQTLGQSSEVLTSLLESVPVQARPGLERAINVSNSGESKARGLQGESQPIPEISPMLTPTPTRQTGSRRTPPGQDQGPSPGSNKTPGEPAHGSGQEVPPGLTKTPMPPGQNKPPLPPGQNKTP